MQEKILQHSNDKDVTATETSAAQKSDNVDLQLTIQIPTQGDVIYETPPAAYHQFPFYPSMFHTEQFAEHQMNQNMAYPVSMPIPNRTVIPSEVSSVNRPDMYIVNRTERCSDGESDRSSEEEEHDAIPGMKPCNSVEKLDSSTSGKSLQYSPPSDCSNKSESDTFDSPHPLKENGKKTKMRTNYTPNQVQALERMFTENAYPDTAQMEPLSRNLDIPQARLKIWFQNKRARFRRHNREKPKNMQMPLMSPVPPMMPQMAPYGFMPYQHPMLHGPSSQVVPSPFFYPGQSLGIPGHPMSVPVATATQPSTPVTKSSPVPSTSPTTSPNTSDTSPNATDRIKPEYQQTPSPYHPKPPHIQPYMPFPYPYGMYNPYYC